MNIKRCDRGAAFPLAALLLSACVSQSAYYEQGEQLKEAQAQSAAREAEIAKMQSENKWVMAGDMLFPEGGYQWGPPVKRRSAARPAAEVSAKHQGGGLRLHR